MKLKNILSGSIALATLATTAQADVEVRITGATAFRTAAINALKAQFDLGGSYTFAHNKAAGGVNGADRVTFKGTFPGVAGITTVRVSHNGSVEGVRAIATPGPTTNPFFITDAALASPGTDAGEAPNENANVGGSTVQQVAKFSYTDVRQSSTPVSSPTLSPANPRVGVTLFTMLANEGAPAGLTNVTFQQFKALFSQGSLPLSVFTGDAADTDLVYATGRNDGSGTRTAYMAESQLGITTLTSQFVATTSAGNAISVIQKVPAGGATINGVFDPTSKSDLWAQDLDGNGGYFSGSVLRTEMGRTTAATQVLDADGSELAPAAQLHLITFLSAADAVPARVAGAKVLGWNGSTLNSLNTGLVVDSTDLAKITEGQYSAWTFQNLYYNGSLTADENTVYNAIRTGIPTSLIAAGYVPGVPSTIMSVSRPDDGAPIAP
jgi:hypothetical protein